MRFSAARVFRMKLGGATWKEVAGSSNNDKRRGYFLSAETADQFTTIRLILLSFRPWRYSEAKETREHTCFGLEISIFKSDLTSAATGGRLETES